MVVWKYTRLGTMTARTIPNCHSDTRENSKNM